MLFRLPAAKLPLRCRWEVSRCGGSPLRPGWRSGSTRTGCATRKPPSASARGTPINVIRDQLGHSSLAVTDRYLRNVAPADLIALGPP